jgi:iterative type I PKS product template protein
MAKKSLRGNDATYASSLRPTEGSWTTISTSLKGLFLECAPVRWSEVYAGSGARYLNSTPPYPLFPAEFVVPFREPSIDQTHCPGPDSSLVSNLFFQLCKKPSSGKAIAAFEAKLSLMSSFITAHVVGGTPLCPASVYIELALQALNQHQPAHSRETHVLRNISFESPLVCSGTSGDKGSLSIILAENDSTKGGSSYYFKAERAGTSYCTGAVNFELVAKVETLLFRKSAFIKKHVESMLRMNDAACDSFSARMIYNVVFPRVVSYSDPFLTLQRLRISSSGLEGYGSFRLPASSSANFVCHPALLDTLLHTAGFVANNWISRDQACICVKVENITLQHDKLLASGSDELSIYCSMVDCVDGFVIGDAYAIDESGTVVALAEGMHFKKTGLKAFQSYLARLAEGGKRHNLATPNRDTAKKSIIQAKPTHNVNTQRTQDPDIIPMLRQEISQLCGIDSNIDIDADLAQLGIDSLLFIELTQALRQSFSHVNNSGLDLSRCSTLRDLESALLSMTVSSGLSNTIVPGTEIDPAPSQTPVPMFTESNTPLSNNSPLSVVKNLVDKICGCQIFDFDKDVSLESLGVDSLLSMELEQGLRQVGGISVDGDHGIISELTVGQLEKVILAKFSQAQSPITPQSSPSPVPTDAAIKLQNGQDSRNRVYLFHDGSGLSHQYTKIGPLGCEVYGVSSLDFAGIDPAIQNLEDFASRYISLLDLPLRGSQGVILGGR